MCSENRTLKKHPRSRDSLSHTVAMTAVLLFQEPPKTSDHPPPTGSQYCAGGGCDDSIDCLFVCLFAVGMSATSFADIRMPGDTRTNAEWQRDWQERNRHRLNPNASHLLNPVIWAAKPAPAPLERPHHPQSKSRRPRVVLDSRFLASSLPNCCDQARAFLMICRATPGSVLEPVGRVEYSRSAVERLAKLARQPLVSCFHWHASVCWFCESIIVGCRALVSSCCFRSQQPCGTQIPREVIYFPHRAVGLAGHALNRSPLWFRQRRCQAAIASNSTRRSRWN